MTIPDAITLMRENRVLRLKCADFEIELAGDAFDRKPVVDETPMPQTPMFEPATCRCGHDSAEHMNGGCMYCPDPSSCHEPKKEGTA